MLISAYRATPTLTSTPPAVKAAAEETPQPQAEEANCDCHSIQATQRFVWRQVGILTGLGAGVYAGAADGLAAAGAGAMAGGIVGAAAGMVAGRVLDRVLGNENLSYSTYLAVGAGVVGAAAGTMAGLTYTGFLPAAAMGAAASYSGYLLSNRGLELVN
ncbi:MAG: hypothetical protein AB7S38_09060 [Vulcanimicrobiota bacterium]